MCLDENQFVVWSSSVIEMINLSKKNDIIILWYILDR